jgi:hypothetical protein
MAMQASMEQAIQAGAAGGGASNGTPASATPELAPMLATYADTAAAAKAPSGSKVNVFA